MDTFVPCGTPVRGGLTVLEACVTIAGVRITGVRISIVVPAFNEAGGLGATLHSIAMAAAVFDRRGWRHETIVCDNNSTDGTADVARAAGAAVVFEPINQISRARNTGAAQATGDWFIFVDADSHPSAALFEDVAHTIDDGRCLAGGSTVTLDGAWLARAAVRVWNGFSRVSGFAAGAFIFCEAAAFRELGGFNVDLFAAEELDLFRRLKPLARRRGRRIVILHRHPLVTSDRKARLYSKSEMARSMFKVLITRGRALKNRDDCYAWYDGRRE